MRGWSEKMQLHYSQGKKVLTVCWDSWHEVESDSTTFRRLFPSPSWDLISLLIVGAIHFQDR